MKNIKLFKKKFKNPATKIFLFFFGALTSGLAFSTNMIISPNTLKGKVNEIIPIEIKFDGKVESLTMFSPICPHQFTKCILLAPSVKIYDQKNVIVAFSGGPLTCGPNSGSIIVRGVIHESCNNTKVIVNLPAKSLAGKYTYTVKRESEFYAESFSSVIVVTVGANDAISAILPIVLD